MKAQDRRMMLERVRIAKFSEDPEKPLLACNPVNRQALVDYLEVVKELHPEGKGGFAISMVCGNEKSFASLDVLPYEDIPCPCGRAGHFLIKYSREPLGLNELTHIS